MVASSSSSVGSSPRSKVPFVLIITCKEELLPTLKITTYLPHLPFDNENMKHTSNPIL